MLNPHSTIRLAVPARWSSLYGLAIAPDARSLAAGMEDGSVRLIDIASGQETTKLVGHVNSIFGNEHSAYCSCVNFSRDGKLLASGGGDSGIVWDVASKEKRAAFKIGRPKTDVTFAGFVSDDLVAMTIKADGMFPKGSQVWSIASGAKVAGSDVGGGPGRISPDGSIYAVVHERGVQLFEAASLTPARWEGGFGGRTDIIAFSPDGAFWAASHTAPNGHENLPGALLLFDTARGLLHKHAHPCYIKCLAFTPDGRFLIGGDYKDFVLIFDAETLKLLGQVELQARLSSGAFVYHAESGLLYTGHGDGAVRTWNLASFVPKPSRRSAPEPPPDAGPGLQFTFVEANKSDHRSIAFAPDGRTFFVGRAAPEIDARGFPSGRLLYRLVHDHADRNFMPTQMTVAPNGRLLAALANGVDRPLLWDLATAKPIVNQLERGPLPSARVDWVAFDPASTRLLSAHNGERKFVVLVHDLASGKIKQELFCAAKVVSAAFSPDGAGVIVGMQDGAACMFDMATGTRLVTPQGDPNAFQTRNPVGVSPDGELLLSSPGGGTVRVSRISDGAEVCRFRQHWSSSGIYAAQFLRNGLAFSAGTDHVLRCWKPLTGEEVAAYEAKDFTHVVLSPDETRVLLLDHDWVRVYRLPRLLVGDADPAEAYYYTRKVFVGPEEFYRLKAGPFTLDGLKRAAADGFVRPDDMVWKKGEAKWSPASMVLGQ